jgi:putative FmdB family regulatory protein
MPIYEYECKTCGNIQEALQRFSDEPLDKCEHCSGKLHRLISQNSFHLKGSGWYVTDYAKKSNTPTNSSKKQKKAASTPASGTSADKHKKDT